MTAVLLLALTLPAPTPVCPCDPCLCEDCQCGVEQVQQEPDVEPLFFATDCFVIGWQELFECGDLDSLMRYWEMAWWTVWYWSVPV